MPEAIPSSPSSKEVVARTLQGLETPRIATGPLAVHYCARSAGVSLREFTNNPLVLADCVIRYHERFEPDAIWLSSDTWVSAQAMGATVDTMEGDQPMGGSGVPLIQTARDIARIPSPDPGAQGRYPLMLEALARIVDALGKEVFIVACFDQYPFSLASALLGLNETMLKLSDDPLMVEDLMERGLEYGLAYARALSDAGADMLSGGDSPAGLIGPSAYRKFAQPFEKRLIAELKSHTQKTVSLHICGNADSILGDMANTGAEVLEIDQNVDLARACHKVGPEIGLWGNLDPVALLAQGNAEQIRQAVRQVLQVVRKHGHRRFVLSSGCTLAVETPSENLEAMLDMANSKDIE